MITITLTDEDIRYLEQIEIDKDEKEALIFICENIIAKIKQKNNFKMKSHLEGGKGTIL